jgi:hypothetical protein
MPSVTLHLLLADNVLAELESRVDPPPFDLDVPALRNAFRHGSLGPDLGYFPGGQRFLSDLAHSVGSADLTRTLVFGARTALERAFAWGWATHVLADLRIHPWIGLAVGRLRKRQPWTFVSGDEDPVGHVRVETGLDAWISSRHPEVSIAPLDTVFDIASVRFLSHAYRRRYGVSLDPRVFLASHTATTRMGRWALFATRVLGRELAEDRTSVALRAARALLRVHAGPRRAADRSVALAYLTPVAPEPWLLDEAEAEIRTFPERFVEVAKSGFLALENRNLDTGEPDPIGSSEGDTSPTRPLRPVTAKTAIPAAAGR